MHINIYRELYIYIYIYEKISEPCPTHTQRHLSTREIRLALDLCFGVGQTRRFFTTADYWEAIQPLNHRIYVRLLGK
jgi:hypothetical protein